MITKSSTCLTWEAFNAWLIVDYAQARLVDRWHEGESPNPPPHNAIICTLDLVNITRVTPRAWWPMRVRKVVKDMLLPKTLNYKTWAMVIPSSPWTLWNGLLTLDSIKEGLVVQSHILPTNSSPGPIKVLLFIDLTFISPNLVRRSCSNSLDFGASDITINIKHL